MRTKRNAPMGCTLDVFLKGQGTFKALLQRQ